jgi:hypothetical protein
MRSESIFHVDHCSFERGSEDEGLVSLVDPEQSGKQRSQAELKSASREFVQSRIASLG